jgi:hypothetical protein
VDTVLWRNSTNKRGGGGDSLDGRSVRRKASTYTQYIINKYTFYL